ncbi:hypothetical protein PVAND_005955 [Polypedilum vanderplanki]|uniref:Peptidase M12B domain-containing protein n=1 Tax=Polypedilum vanderplanki TaxID=319348 RepID=A0A9J6C2J5_POLVA|nr:hypothetical protein PVAND_005955 [Polypedilum vanderplanki]
MLTFELTILFLLKFSIVQSSLTPRNALHRFMDIDELQFYFGTNSLSSIETIDYEIVDLPENLYSGRESVTENGRDDAKFVNFKVFNKQIELNLYPNKNLISPYTKIVKKNRNSTVNKFYANSEPKFCHFLHVNNRSTAAISNCDSREIHGLIFLPDDSLEILPLTTRLKSFIPEKFYEEINDGSRTVMISKIPHLIKRSSFTNVGSFENDYVVADFRYINFKKKLQKKNRGISFERPTVELGLFFDEEFYKIFAPFFEYDDKKLENFILSYINGMQSLYHHNSLERPIDFTVVYLEIMETQADEMPHAYGERNELIDNFCEYQKQLNPKDDRNPEHWDMAVYVSSLDFFAWEANGSKNGATMGLATVGGVCQEDFNCIIAEFGTNNQFGRPYPSAGFTSVYILAHEIGHNLGMNHDSTGNSCTKEGYVMSPSRGSQGETTWSSCSALTVKKLDAWAKCLFDKPSKASSQFDAWKFNGKPGVSYTAKDQCEILLRDHDAYPFYNSQKSSICESLHCRTPNRSGFFFAGPALPGTDCGNESWCDGGECVKRNSITSTTKKSSTITTTTQATTTILHQLIHNNDSTWTSWTKQKCNSECLKYSRGTQIVTRKCLNGACEGSSLSVELCDDKFICSTRKSVIEYGTKRCKEFSKKLNNIDDKGLGLQANYDIIRPWMPCAIFCKHKNSSSYITPRFELNKLGIDAYFPDGTWCNREGNIDFFCLQHHCLPENIKLTKSPIIPTEEEKDYILQEDAFSFHFDKTDENHHNSMFVTFRPFELKVMLRIIALLFLVNFVSTKIHYTSVISTSNTKYANYSAVIFDSIYMNATFTTAIDLAKVLITFTFSLPKNDQDKNYELMLFHSTLQSCKVMQGNRPNFIIRMAMDEPNKFNALFQCPLPANTYGFYNFKANDKLLPPIMIGRSIKFQLVVKCDGKRMNSKSVVWMFSIKLQGEVRGD